MFVSCFVVCKSGVEFKIDRTETIIVSMESLPSELSGSNIQFSPTYTYSGKKCQYSPNGEYILFTTGKQVEVVQSETQNSLFTLFCSDRVDFAEWSPDSTRILCIIRRNNSIEVWKEIWTVIRRFSQLLIYLGILHLKMIHTQSSLHVGHLIAIISSLLVKAEWLLVFGQSTQTMCTD